MVWRQIIGYIPVNLTNLIVSFGGIIILTRLLDAAEFGLYSLVLISLQILHTIVFTWTEAAMERFYVRSQREGNLKDHLVTLYQTSLVLAVIGIIAFLLVIIALPISTDLKTILAFALTSTTVQTVVRLGLEAHKADNRITRYSLAYSSQMILSFTIGIVLIMVTPLGVAGPFAGLLIGNLIVLVFDLPFMLKRIKGGKYQPDRTKQYLAYGLPICFSLVLELALSQSDRFLIQIILSASEVGEYSAGYGLANRSIDIIFIWIGLAVTPMLVRSFELDGLQASVGEMKNYGSTLLLITLPAACGLGLVAEPVSHILGESVRENGGRLIPWIVGAGVMNGLISYYIQRAFMLSGKTKVLPIIMIAPMVLNIILNIIMLPIFGLMGAVYATLISYGFGIVLAFVIARKYYPLPLPIEALIRCGFACAVMAGIVLAIHLPEGTHPFVEVVIKGAAGASTYGLVAFATNAANCRELCINLIARIKSAKVVDA